MKHQKAVEKIVMGGQIILVYFNQLAAGVLVFPGEMKKGLDAFLFHAVQLQKLPVWLDLPVDIDACDIVKVIGKTVGRTPF